MRDDAFCALLDRVRAGDPSAAEELVRLSADAVRRFVRVRLTSPQLRRVIDSADVVQSVLGSFFARAGAYQLDGPQQLVSLLIVIARNKLVSRARHEIAFGDCLRALAADRGDRCRPDPGEWADSADLLQTFRSALPPRQQQVLDLRLSDPGLTWADIGARFGLNGERLRQDFERQRRRVCRALGLEADDA